LVNENSKEVSCNKFKEQVDMAFNNVSASKYKRDLLKGLLSTILDSSFKLKKYQVDFIKSKAESDFEYLAKETYAGCPNESLLSNQLKLIDSIKYSTSLKASWIGGKIAELQRDGECGELSQFYCLAELRREAAKKAYDVVKKCDDEENFDGQCAMDAEGLYISELKKIEILKLSEHREKHEQYIADPVRGVGERGFVYLVADRIVLDTMANDCRRLALKSGLKGEDYTKYEKDVCIPNAKTEYVKPQVLILQKIINRLNFIQK
jgi:hypothetical protein